MRAAAALALILTVTPAAAGPVDYAAAYGQARTYGLAHLEQVRQPSCRAAIGPREADLLLEACDRVVGGSSRNACTAASTCAQVLDRLDWCSEWKGSVPCVPVADGGEDRQGRDMGEWWTRVP
ncbi:hypothetical protein [Methylorubrum thiocyanatum]|uniref:hypothetical protein n=1 Tax=Methylorubrum thiocyanatum TaxID=47958 RepID=UPI0035C82831